MTSKEIKKQALDLSEDHRAELAHMLIDSLHPSQVESERAWSEELKHRITQYEENHASTKPWSEVKKKALGMIE